MDRVGAGKDFGLCPGGGRDTDWAETGTRHQPGIQPADVEELLAHGASVVVLSQGMEQRLHVAPAACEYLEIFSDLAEVGLVGGLFHCTC